MPFANRSRAYDPDADEALHHDLFVDLLQSAITRSGTYREVAARAGVSERYLFYIRDKERPVPSVGRLERIIGAMPELSAAEAQALREFARRASRYRLPPGSTRLVLDDAEVGARLAHLLAENHRATHAETADAAKRRYAAVKLAAARLLKRVPNLFADPGTSAQLYLLHSDVSNVLDDPAAALKSARLAQLVLEEHAARTERADPRLDELRVEALRAEGVTLHNLHMNQMALDRYRLALLLADSLPGSQQPVYLALDSIAAMSANRRFRMREVKMLVDEIQRGCDNDVFTDPERDLALLRAGRGLANAYVRHGDLKPRTERILRQELERLDRVPLAGPIHRVQLYRAFAGLCHARGDREGTDHVVVLAAATAREAGLTHQARRLEEEFAEPRPVGRPRR